MKLISWQLVFFSLIFFNSAAMETSIDSEVLKKITKSARSGEAESMLWIAQYSFMQNQYYVGIKWLSYYYMRAQQDFDLLNPIYKSGKWPIISDRVSLLINRFPGVKEIVLANPEKIEKERQQTAQYLQTLTEREDLPHPKWILDYFSESYSSPNLPKLIPYWDWQKKRVQVLQKLLKPQPVLVFTPILTRNNECDELYAMPLPPLPSITEGNEFVENE